MPEFQRQRASPEALLALSSKERRGRLKIFLGAAPGVGKTYAMLRAARDAKAEGRDVAVGLAETHGRKETEALLDGLEQIPRYPTVYFGRILSEFDIDKALARRPGLLLLDELAHTNVAGSRHPKRSQDVEELLAAGIDVWTTLNIQHLESLNDIVRKITGVQVRETVPDRVFETADEIVLVDLPTEELLKRLAEGKVYLPETASRAAKSFFKTQNLTALRELALRRAAERIDADLVQRMQAQAIDGPWAAGERVLACIGPDPFAVSIVRAAKRLADLMDAPWIATTVERPSDRLNEDQRKLVDDALKLARNLGAETEILLGSDIPGEILRFARSENITQIVIGRARGGTLAELFRRSLPHELVRRAEDIAIHFITGSNRDSRKPAARGRQLASVPEIAPFVWAAIGVTCAVAVGQLLATVTSLPNISMVFLLAVLIPAVAFGIWPAVFASVLSFFAYNFFFIEPLYDLTVAEPHELLALAVFLVIAVITSTLAGRVREQARIALERMRATRRLYEVTRKLSAMASLGDIAEAAAAEVHESLRRPTLVLLAENAELLVKGAWPPEDQLDTASATAARWSLQHDEPAGSRTSTLPTVPWLFVPLRTPRTRVGVLGVLHDNSQPPIDIEGRALLDTLADQIAAALERAMLAQQMVSAREAVETEQIRNTLLASISHDFRTPLASILGSATSLIELPDKFDAKTRRDLLDHIKQETEHLDEMVRNLLAMTRIDSGMLELHWSWVNISDVVARAVQKARKRGASQLVEIRLPDDLPMIWADASLAEQVVTNVLGNALMHTGDDAQVIVDGQVRSGQIVVRVTDDGPGIATEDLSKVFKKFVRAQAQASRKGDAGEGTGLGLAIAKGIMEAHGGSIAAESPVDRGKGTRVILTFPRKETPS